MKHTRSSKHLEFVALCLLAILIIWLLGRSLDWGQVRKAVGSANWSLLAIATAIISVAYLFRAFRWSALLAPLAPAPIRDLFIATTVGFGAVFLIGRAGEVVRPVVLPMRCPQVKPGASIVTIMVERIYDLLAVIFLFAINLLWFNSSAISTQELRRVRLVGFVILGGSFLSLALLVWFRKQSPIVIQWLTRRFERSSFIPKRLFQVVLSMLEQLARALRVLVDARELAVTIGWTALLWIGVAGANLLVFRAFGLQFGVTEAVFVLGWSLLGSLVPTPGGAAGAFHAATAAGLIFLGVARETAAAVSIVLHLVDFGPALIFGIFYLVRGDVSFSRLRSLSSSEAVEEAVKREGIRPLDRREDLL